MTRCEKCGATLQDNDVVYWKCTECDKAFKVDLPKLRNINRLKSKAENANKSLLKCPSCGKGLDNGNELLFCKCASCGNVIKGNLKFFTSEDNGNEIKNSNTECLNTSSATDKCPKCGEEISKTTNYCPNCGHKFKPRLKSKEDIEKHKTRKWYKLPILISAALCIAVFGILLITGKGSITAAFNFIKSSNFGTDINNNENIAIDTVHIFPFSDADWTSELGDLIILHGDYDDKYDSTYGGPCYVFNNIEYQSLQGLLRYFYNDNNKLVSVRFDCDFKTKEELEAVYLSNLEEMQSKLGQSGYQMNDSGFTSEMWYRPEGNISLESVIMLKNTLRIQYLSPEISRKEPPSKGTDITETDTKNIVENQDNFEDVILGTTITVDKQCEFEIVSYAITDMIEPPTPDNYYHYYESDDGMIFVDIVINIKSLKNKAVTQNSLVGLAKVIYDSQYEYNTQLTVEEDNGKDLNGYPNLYSIEPLSTLKYHFFASVPYEVIYNDKALDFVINVGDNSYKCKLR